MKVLKAMLCIVIAFMLTLPAKSLSANADSGRKYAVATSRYVYLCEEMDSNSDRFAIPYSYCVEIKKEYADWYFVSYAKDEGIYSSVSGYCKKEDLMEVENPPQNAYLYYPLDVVLHSTPKDNGTLPDLETTVTVPFYGNYYKGATAYKCVLFEGKFGYIEGEIDNYETNELPSAPTFSPSVTPSQNEGNAKWITFFIIAALAVAAIVILIVTGKRKKIK